MSPAGDGPKVEGGVVISLFGGDRARRSVSPPRDVRKAPTRKTLDDWQAQTQGLRTQRAKLRALDSSRDV